MLLGAMPYMQKSETHCKLELSYNIQQIDQAGKRIHEAILQNHIYGVKHCQINLNLHLFTTLIY